MEIIDANRLLSDRKYRTLLYEYHSLVAYIAEDLNRYNKIQSAGVKFHKTSDLYDLKEELIQMLKDTFPQFEVFLEKYGERYDLDKDEFNICVCWKNYRDNNKKLQLVK
jgi:hypothetical protein